MKKLELVGKKFNKLTVLSYEYTDKVQRTFWRCLCDCGKEKIIKGSKNKKNYKTQKT